jgi:hypothetical protein
MKLAADNSDFTIQGWLRNRSHRRLTEDEKVALKATLALDHACKEMIRYGRRAA